MNTEGAPVRPEHVGVGGAASVGAAWRDAARWIDAHPLGERVLLAAAIATSWSAGYHAIGWTTDVGAAVALGTALDRAVPFVPETVYLYGLVYAASLYPLFAIRSRALLRRAALAYVLVIAASLTCFALFPVTCAGFRPPLEALEARTLHGWALRLVYTLDPPTNLFPSLHVGLAAIGAAATWQASRALAVPAVGILAATLVSILTVKQHFLVDALAALLVVSLVHDQVLRPFRPAPGDEPLAFSWRGPTGYLVLQVGLYALLALAYVAGVRV
jgi:hypothetical protein